MYYCKHCDELLENIEGFCPSCGQEIAAVGYYESNDGNAAGGEYDYGYDYEEDSYLDEQGSYHDPDVEGDPAQNGYGYDDYDDYDDDDFTEEGIGDSTDYYADNMPGGAYVEKKKGLFGKSKKEKKGKSDKGNKYDTRRDSGIYAPAPAGDGPALSLKQCLGIEAIALLPLVGLIFYIIWAIGGKAQENPTRANVARSKLIMMGIGVLLSILLTVLMGAAGMALFNQMSSGMEEMEPGSEISINDENGVWEEYEITEGEGEWSEGEMTTEEQNPSAEDKYISGGSESTGEDMPGEEIDLQPTDVQSPNTAPTGGYDGLLSILRTETHAREWRSIDSNMSIAMGECVITTSSAGEPVLALTIYAQNQSGMELTYGTSVFDYAVQNGVMLEKNALTFNDTETYTAYNVISSGSETTIYLAYTLPDTASEITLTLEPWATTGAQPATYSISPAAAASVPR